DPAHHPVRVDVTPDPVDRNRLTILFRLFMLIPQMLFGILIGIGIWFVSIIGWLAVIIVGRWPAGLRDFAVGALRWSTRVNGYYLLLTDEYPPFSLDERLDRPGSGCFCRQYFDQSRPNTASRARFKSSISTRPKRSTNAPRRDWGSITVSCSTKTRVFVSPMLISGRNEAARLPVEVGTISHVDSGRSSD